MVHVLSYPEMILWVFLKTLETVEGSNQKAVLGACSGIE